VLLLPGWVSGWIKPKRAALKSKGKA
jgi:hypothetical protein